MFSNFQIHCLKISFDLLLNFCTPVVGSTKVLTTTGLQVTAYMSFRETRSRIFQQRIVSGFDQIINAIKGIIQYARNFSAILEKFSKLND